MSGYQVTNPSYFNISSMLSQLSDQVVLLENTVSVPAQETTYGSTASATYTADAMLGGYIVRENHVEGSNIVVDTFPSATALITAMKQKMLGIATFTKPLPNGSSFVCKLYNKSGITNLKYYSDTANGLFVGGSFSERGYQIVHDATCTLTVVVLDQASLGQGHTDKVFICMSRCAALISYLD
jgi:hypothetical protein